MYNRYHGNSGKVTRVSEAHDNAPPRRSEAPSHAGTKPLGEFKSNTANSFEPALRLPSFISGGLGQLISGSLAGLETEDIILLLILYLMYRESGDSELLIMMGAMFLL